MDKLNAGIEAGKEIIEIADKGADVGKKIIALRREVLADNDEHNKNVQELNNNQRMDDLDYAEKAVDVIGNAMEKAPVIIHNAGDTAIAALQESTRIWKEIKSHIRIKDHGSKVKEGVYAESSIDDVGHVRIIIDKSHKHDVLLTPENVLECEFLKEKERTVAFKKKMYYYYRVTFVDKQVCYIRISKKLKNILINTIKIT